MYQMLLEPKQINRVAPCGCTYLIQGGKVLEYQDCANHGGNAGKIY